MLLAPTPSKGTQMATPCFSPGCSGTMTLVPNHDPRLTDPASRFNLSAQQLLTMSSNTRGRCLSTPPALHELTVVGVIAGGKQQTISVG